MNKTKSATTNPAPVTPIEQDVVQGEENSNLALTQQPTADLLPPDTIRSEVNFLTYPFFALSRTDAQKRTKAEYRSVEKRGDKTLERYWKVSANAEYGYPGVFDSRVHKAIEQIISNLPRPIENPIPLGSLLNLAKLIGIGLSSKGKLPGKSYKEIQESLRRIKHTAIDAKGTFYDKGEEKFIDASFNLYDEVVFIGEKLRSGEVADTNYLYLGRRYIESINDRYVKPLDYTYYRTLQSPISARLYELLGVKFYGMGKYPYIRYRYSNLCQLLPTPRYKYLSKAKEKLEPAHRELIDTKFFATVAWEKVKDDPLDWYVSYYPGARAKKEIEDGKRKGQVALPPPEDREPVISVTPQPAPATPIQPVADAIVNVLLEFGITKKQAQKLAKDYPEHYILTKLEMVKFLAETQDPLVAKNPQGFLVRALQDDYQAPPQYQRKAQQDRIAEERQQREEREQQARKAAREQAREQLQQEYPPQTIAGTEHTTASAWAKTLEVLQGQVHKGTFALWLKDTLLIGMEGNTAQVLVTNPLAPEYLKKRLDGLIVSSLEQVLGYPVQVEFVVAEETT